MRKHKSGFTIIELIVVMTIIIILAGLVTTAAQKAKQQAMVAQARAMISGVETALGMFQADLGGYPSPARGNTNLVTALQTSAGFYVVGTVEFPLPTTNWSGPYMQFKQGELNGGAVQDAWHNAFTYRAGTDHTGTGGPNYTTYIDLFSNGPDGTTGTADDISNWSK